ncbi:hypothetical protein TREMEDRAFT_64422 [Tremella mesenterica DSM 1558]|uniref:uncharacterized protein n=1 Tax=Tremella mesenterica (strain ATCC 24925 / CBS 8224 / DSM 1558 / NBRC 9311 / NRRL Y-6157 / RJB 2259-6 / UBC 559-6) TaxID=578456 RepID=UPI0003F4A29D|nr:uncharacterized protein TREMEDRAFT_64422 [Tremella mesenterica DSM 1558]EIW67182.1 hypothetical protein TREMEDRAFT_64422 [Tremella mesenterica DSM 1558]
MYPVYLHVARDFDGSRTGLALLPSSVMGPLASLYAGWHMRRFAEYKKFQVVMSFLPWVQALGVVLLWRIDTGFIRLSIEMAVGASGVGAVMTSLLTSLVACVDPAEMSMAMSALYLFRALGQVLGVAVSAAIQQSILLSSLTTRLSGIPSGEGMKLIHEIIEQPTSVIPHLNEWTAIQARQAYLESIEGVFGIVVLAGVALTIVCLGVKARPL